MFTTKPITTREEGLKRLLEVNRCAAEGWTLLGDSLILADGRRVPLLPWRADFHYTAFRNLSAGDEIRFGQTHARALTGLSVFRLLYAGLRGESLDDILLRELDLSEWLTDARTVSVFAMRNGDVMHVSTRLDSGVVCTLELSAVLPPTAQPVFKHELTTESGFVTDRAVDTIVTPHGMYLLSDEGAQAFDEVDTLTYGLSPEDARAARAAYALLCGAADPAEYIAAEARLVKLRALAAKSCETGEPVDTREVNG